MSNTSLPFVPSVSPTLHQDLEYPKDTLDHLASLSPSVLHALSLLFPHRYGHVSQPTRAQI
jgi:hypothetical protein